MKWVINIPRFENTTSQIQNFNISPWASPLRITEPITLTTGPMLKKVLITNVHSGAKHSAIVDTDSHEKALIGSGMAANESATIEDITGVDETIHRVTLPKGG